MKRSVAKTEVGALQEAKFGTFKGVFTPAILTILGVIMYLRFGWVVGHGGLVGAVVVVLLAHVISFTTGMSLSSIATNRTVKIGGDYYMISRSLGLPIGGAIGIALFFALAFSMSLYVIGFSETFLDVVGIKNTLLARQITGTIACLALTVLTFFSTSLALRVQYFILAAIALSLVSLVIGKSPAPPGESIKLWFSPESESFENVFAVFFPAVTGFTAGVAMSGDLKDPRRAIPLGTMAAIFVGLFVYLLTPVFFAFNVDTAVLKTDQMIWLRIGRVPQLIVAGIFAATLSSALGSVLGAPRYLQALAMDGVVPKFLAKGYGVLNEPRIGTIATFVIAEAGIIIGELDLIARIITMFFLTSYGFICLACGVQSWSGISSFRPDFKTPPWVSFLGALTCLGMMFKLDTAAMAGATVLMAGIFFVLKRRQFRSSPKDSWGGFWAAVVQKGVLKLHHRATDSINWRPNLIVFGGEPSERQYLIHLANWIVQNRGLCTYFYLIQGDIRAESARARKLEPGVRNLVTAFYPEMLTRVSVSQDIYQGIVGASQSYGLSGMIPNTVLMGWADESEQPDKFTDLVRDLLALDHNLLFLKHDDERSFGQHERIDIWWGGLERNGQLMMLLAYLITSADTWVDSGVRINVAVENQSSAETARANLEKIVSESRIAADLNIIVQDPAKHPIAETIAQVSSKADLVIVGLRPPREDETDRFVAHVGELLAGVGTALLVRASSHFDGASLLFDSE
ncbi:MAG: amino acid permease [Deltaproteobacteria bacterium]|nr:amino acid permease [Deltaproteobacteria bacterium]